MVYCYNFECEDVMNKDEQKVEYKWYHYVITLVVIVPIIVWAFFEDEILLQIDLHKCVKSGECLYKEFNGGKYLVKNKASEDFIYYLLEYPAIVNTVNGTVHRDGCLAAKICTKNCVYMEESSAFGMLENNSLMHYCKIEEAILRSTDPNKYADYCLECYEDRFTGDGDCSVNLDCVTRETIYRFFENNSIQDALNLIN